MDLSERKLKAIVAIADNGSLGRAAEALNVTQPALSRTISELEAGLQTRLFERHSKGMVPTEAGAILVDHARQLAFDLGQARHALLELRGMRSGNVRIGAVAAATRTIIPAAIMALRSQAPGLTVELMEAPDSELIDALLERRIDLMVASDRIAHSEILPLEFCDYQDAFRVCCRAHNPPVSANAQLDDVLACDWVMLKRGRTPRTHFDELVASTGRPMPRIAVETTSIGSQIGIVRQTDLLAWLPQAVIADYLTTGDLCVLDVPQLARHRRFRAYRRKNGYFPEHAALLHRCLIG